MAYVFYNESGTIDPGAWKRWHDECRPGGSFYGKHGKFTWGPTDEVEPKSTVLPRYTKVHQAEHTDIGQQLPKRFARASLTDGQRDRLTRGLCEEWFRPHRKEYAS